MRKAEQRGWTRKSAPEFTERHHVFPVSIFGKNSKTILLTPREHYIAHLLLYKATLKRYGQHRFTFAMAKAVTAMCITESKLQNRTYLPSRVVATARGMAADSQRGVPKPKSTREKMSQARLGRKFNPHSDETKAKMSQSHLGRKATPETRAKMSASRKGKTPNIGHKKKLSEANLGMNRWNNGVSRTWARECPGDGWVPGWNLEVK